MKTSELRNRVSNLARNQMTAEQANQSLRELVNTLDQLESGQELEMSRLRRQFRWLSLAMATVVLMLGLTCCWLFWQNHQLRQEVAQSQTQLARHQEKLTYHESVLLRLVKMMTSQPSSQTGRP